MSSWYWKGAWNKSRADGGKGGGKKKKKGKDEKPENPKGEAMFPSYDAMPLSGSSGSSSSAAPSSQESQLKQLMRVLVETNAVKIPEEAKHLLEDNKGDAFRDELKKTQTVLNKRRKAFSKVQRLKAAIQQKSDQFMAFKEKIKEQLQQQQAKFEEDTQSLEKSLQEAEDALKAIMEEDNEDPQEPQPEDDKEAKTAKMDLELAQLLEDKDYGQKLVALEDQLKHSKAENLITKQMFNAQAAQMQSYMQKLESMQSTLLHFQHDVKGPQSPSATMTFGGKGSETAAASPQLTKPPVLGKRDPLQPFARIGEIKKQRLEPETKQSLGGTGAPIPVVEVDPSQSQEIQGMDWLAAIRLAAQ